MSHRLHGTWRSFVIFEDGNGDLFVNSDGTIFLNMPDPTNNTVQPGSDHMTRPVTGEATLADTRIFLELRQATLRRRYQGYLDEIDIGGTTRKIIMGRVKNNAFVAADEKAASTKNKDAQARANALTPGQEEGTWVATQP